eukprot:g46340.t1
MNMTVGKAGKIDLGRVDDPSYVRDVREFIVALRTVAKQALGDDDIDTICYTLGDVLGGGNTKDITSPALWEKMYNKLTATGGTWKKVDVVHQVLADQFGLRALLDKHAENAAITHETTVRAKKGCSLAEIFEQIMAMCIMHTRGEAYLLILGALWLTPFTKAAVVEMVAQGTQHTAASAEQQARWKLYDTTLHPGNWNQGKPLDEQDVELVEKLIALPAVTNLMPKPAADTRRYNRGNYRNYQRGQEDKNQRSSGGGTGYGGEQRTQTWESTTAPVYTAQSWNTSAESSNRNTSGIYPKGPDISDPSFYSQAAPNTEMTGPHRYLSDGELNPGVPKFERRADRKRNWHTKTCWTGLAMQALGIPGSCKIALNQKMYHDRFETMTPAQKLEAVTELKEAIRHGLWQLGGLKSLFPPQELPRWRRTCIQRDTTTRGEEEEDEEAEEGEDMGEEDAEDRGNTHQLHARSWAGRLWLRAQERALRNNREWERGEEWDPTRRTQVEREDEARPARSEESTRGTGERRRRRKTYCRTDQERKFPTLYRSREGMDGDDTETIVDDIEGKATEEQIKEDTTKTKKILEHPKILETPPKNLGSTMDPVSVFSSKILGPRFKILDQD